MSKETKQFLIFVVVVFIFYLLISHINSVWNAKRTIEKETDVYYRTIDVIAVSAPVELVLSNSRPSIETPMTALAVSSKVQPVAIVKAIVASPVPVNVPDFHHNDDFTTVYFGGLEYNLTLNQARVFEKLWEARQNRTPEVHQGTLLEGLDISSKRLKDVFGSNKTAFKKLFVHGKRQGTYRLNYPV